MKPDAPSIAVRKHTSTAISILDRLHGRAPTVTTELLTAIDRVRVLGMPEEVRYLLDVFEDHLKSGVLVPKGG